MIESNKNKTRRVNLLNKNHLYYDYNNIIVFPFIFSVLLIIANILFFNKYI